MKANTTEWTLAKKLKVLNVIKRVIYKARATHENAFICNILMWKHYIVDGDKKYIKPVFPELYKVIHAANIKWCADNNIKEGEFSCHNGWEYNDYDSRLKAIAKLKEKLTK